MNVSSVINYLMFSVFGWPDLNTWEVAEKAFLNWLFSSLATSQVFGSGHPNTETVRYFFNQVKLSWGACDS